MYMKKLYRLLAVVLVLGLPMVSLSDVVSTNVTSTRGGGGGVSFGGASGGTATRVLFTDGTGLLADDADLTFVTDTLTATKIGSTTLTGTNLATGRNTFGSAADAANTVDFGVTAGAITFEGAAADAAEHTLAATVNAGFDTTTTIPATGATQTVAVLENAQTFTGAKTFSAATTFNSSVTVPNNAVTVGPGTFDGNSWISNSFTNTGQNGITSIGPNASKVTILGRTASSEGTIMSNNGTGTVDIIQALDNGTQVFGVADGGSFEIFRTLTAGGTTGAQTIDRPQGSVNFAASATTLVVTNALATTTSLIFAMAYTNDATCSVKDVERAAGSFTIRMTAACTGETAVGFWVTN